MDNKKNSIGDLVHDSKTFIRTLFEQGVQEKVSDCCKHPQNLYPFSIPCPSWYQGFTDWRSLPEKLFEIECKAKVTLAFSEAYKIKNQIDFYDLICATMANTAKYNQYDVRKFFINEVLKHTSSEELRDYYAKELYQLNARIEQLNKNEEPGISRDAYPLIEGIGKLYRKGKIFEFRYCQVTINNTVTSAEDPFEITLDLCFEELHDIYNEYPLYKAQLRLFGVSCLQYDNQPSIICQDLHLNIHNGGLKLEAYRGSYEGNVVKCQCRRIEVLSFGIAVERNPYEDKTHHIISIHNNSKEDVHICFNKSSFTYIFEEYEFSCGEVFIPKDKNGEIVILPGGILTLHKEVKKAESSKYQTLHLTSSNHPGNMIDYCLIEGKALSKDILIDNTYWKFSLRQDIQGNYVEYDFIMEHALTIEDGML